MATGYITLGDLTRTTVNVACNRCERRGRLPELRRIIAADDATKLHDPCGVRFPGLAG